MIGRKRETNGCCGEGVCVLEKEIEKEFKERSAAELNSYVGQWRWKRSLPPAVCVAKDQVDKLVANLIGNVVSIWYLRVKYAKWVQYYILINRN